MNKLDLTSENAIVNPIDKLKRTHILVTDAEDIRPRGYDNETYIKWINTKYINTYREMLPYHYAITTDGTLFLAKPDSIKTNVSLFSANQNDIIVYVEGSLRKLSELQQGILIKLCVMLCLKYFLEPNSTVFFPYNLLNDTSIKDREKAVIAAIMTALEQKDAVNIVSNSFLREKMNSGQEIEKAEFIYLESQLTVKELSELTGIPQSILLAQNAHLL
jgi:hypothetical protein